MSRDSDSDRPAKDSREDFLARWSRRKLDVPGDDRDAPAHGVAAVTPADSPAAGSQGELSDADMPPVETLDEHSDYSPFLSPGVSDDLRQQALHKLFHQPDYNIADGLNDYDEDFTQFAGLAGLVTHEMKRMLQRELETEPAAAKSAGVNASGTGGSEASRDDATAAAATDSTDRVATHTKNDDPDPGKVPSS